MQYPPHTPQQRWPAEQRVQPVARGQTRTQTNPTHGTWHIQIQGKKACCAPNSHLPAEVPEAPWVASQGEARSPATSHTGKRDLELCLTISALQVGSFLCSNASHMDKWRCHSQPTQRPVSLPKSNGKELSVISPCW